MKAFHLIQATAARHTCAGALLALAPSAAIPANAQTLRAEISYTSYGVPHIKAADLAGAGFGHGYAFAATDLCSVAERWVTVRAERSRFFGSNGPREPMQSVSNLESDFYWQWLIDRDVVGQELKAGPPVGIISEVRDLVRGYVAGYNQYLTETGVDKLPDERCRGKEWVRPITERDVYLRALHVNTMASSGWIGPTVNAVPPGGRQTGASLDLQQEVQPTRVTMSNVIALGRDATDNGKGMVFANPHWRWHGAEKFFEFQLTVPAKLDVYGATFPGLPLVLIGFNRNVAWSHTASVPKRETVYQLRLAPGDPTSYVYAGMTRKMTSHKVTITAKDSSGAPTKQTRTIWETHFGPVITNQLFAWTDTTAFAVRSVVSDFRWLNQHYGMNTARSVGALDSAGRRYMGLTWINTIGADDQGRVIYGDRSSVPHVTEEMRAACTTSDLGKQVWERARLVLFDGSRKDCEWGSDPDSPLPGLFGASRLPMLERWDYATNSNDSHWANSARQLLEGYPAVVGDERTQRSLRTRNGLAKLEKRLAGTDGLTGKGFSLAQLEAVTMDNRVYSAELWRDDLVRFCRTLSAEPNAQACAVLSAWDLTDNLDSPGAVLWRRFMENISPGPQPAAELFTVPLDPKDPVNTPRGLNVSNPKVGEAFGKAVADLRNSGIPLDAKLRDYQVEERAGQRIPIHGGPMSTGQYNLIHQTESGWVPGKGWRNVMHASSYIAWVQFTDRGPVARSVLASSQSDDRSSPHHTDQTLLFSRKESKPVLFDEAAIQADPNLRVVRVCQGGCR